MLFAVFRCCSAVQPASWTSWNAGGSTSQVLATWRTSSGSVSALMIPEWFFFLQTLKLAYIFAYTPLHILCLSVPLRAGEDIRAHQHPDSVRAAVWPGPGLREGLRRVWQLPDRFSQAEVQTHHRQIQRDSRWVVKSVPIHRDCDRLRLSRRHVRLFTFSLHWNRSYRRREARGGNETDRGGNKRCFRHQAPCRPFCGVLGKPKFSQ